MCLALMLPVLSSCNVASKTSDVDFSENKKIQVSYNSLVFDAEIEFFGETLIFKYLNASDSVISVEMNNEDYKIVCNDMVFDGKTKSLPDVFLPKIIFVFFNSQGSMLNFSDFDEDGNCYVFSGEALNKALLFEAYKNLNEGYSYSLTIN